MGKTSSAAWPQRRTSLSFKNRATFKPKSRLLFRRLMNEVGEGRVATCLWLGRYLPWEDFRPQEVRRPQRRNSPRPFSCGAISPPNPHAQAGAATVWNCLCQQVGGGLELSRRENMRAKVPESPQVGQLGLQLARAHLESSPIPSFPIRAGSADVSSASSAPSQSPFPRSVLRPPITDNIPHSLAGADTFSPPRLPLIGNKKPSEFFGKNSEGGRRFP